MTIESLELVERTTHRDDRGGYEHWSFHYNGQKYLLFCDIRIPGIVDSYYQTIPENRKKTIVIDLFTIKEGSIRAEFLSNTLTVEQQIELQTVIKYIILEVIKPNRDFGYISFVVPKEDKDFYKNIFIDITQDPPNEIIKEVYTIISPRVQAYIDAGYMELLVGEII